MGDEMSELKVGDVVVCVVKKLYPNSALVTIVDENVEGMIHVSEIASGWVRDIRHHLKEGQLVVAKIIRIDEIPHLSIKRVRKEEKKRSKEQRRNRSE